MKRLVAWVGVWLFVVPFAWAETSPKKPTARTSPRSLPRLAVPEERKTPENPKPARSDAANKDKASEKKDFKLDRSTVYGRKRKREAAGSKYTIDIGQLRIIPRKSAASQLMLAPGVLTTNHGGEGHAQETFMRGFAAGEGQDIEFLVDGVPLNEVSNPHGHGYTDLYFIPPEFVQSMEITEGPFNARQGDFAFAGTANYKLGVPERGARVLYGFGLRNTHRVLLTYAPPDEPPGTFAGFEFYKTNGYGANRAAQRALGLGRYVLQDAGTLRINISLYGYTARFDQAGVLRQDDVEAERIGFYDTYDTNQGGESNRLLLAIDTAFGPSDNRFSQVMFLGFRTMRIRNNFTGWLTDDLQDANGNRVAQQRGDGTENRYSVFTGGSRGQYDLIRVAGKREFKFSLGYALRVDHGNSGLLRIRSISAIPYRQVFDFMFTVANLAGWLQTQLDLFPWLTLRGGIRLDTFSFGVTDLNQPTTDREGTRIGNQTSQAFGFALNPRATLDFRLWRGLHLLLSYGQGTRSTEAAALSNNETAPFARAQVADAGLSFKWGKKGKGLFIKSQLSYVFTAVDRDLLFDETVGRNILVGSSTRHAVLLGFRLNYNRWLDALVNVGYAYATLDSTGELFPYIPQLVVRSDIAVTGNLFQWKLGKVPVNGRIGVGFTFVPGRPLPFKEFGDPFYLVSLGGQLRLWHFTLGLEIRNMLNLQYRQSEFNYPSNFRGPSAPAARLPERHFAAGEPFYLMTTLTFHLEDLLRNVFPRTQPKPKAAHSHVMKAPQT